MNIYLTIPLHILLNDNDLNNYILYYNKMLSTLPHLFKDDKVVAVEPNYVPIMLSNGWKMF